MKMKFPCSLFQKYFFDDALFDYDIAASPSITQVREKIKFTESRERRFRHFS